MKKSKNTPQHHEEAVDPLEVKKGLPPARPRLAKVNPTARQVRKLTPRQKLFIREYLIDMSPADAYIRAGYDITDRHSAYTLGCRLLKNARIMEEIDRVQGMRLKRLDITGDWAILRFKLVYLEAIKRHDLANACRALENIGKFLGIYEKHNKQKTQYSQGDLERLKTELSEAGFDFSRLNFSEN